MEIKIDSESVNKVVAEAIIKSAMGKELEAAINKAMTEVVPGWDSPVKKLVQNHVHQAIREVLERDYKSKIVEMLSEKLSNEHVATIVDASVTKALELLKSDRY